MNSASPAWTADIARLIPICGSSELRVGVFIVGKSLAGFPYKCCRLLRAEFSLWENSTLAV